MSGAPLEQRGIGLIEILVAVVLMSIGFLAAAQMQVQGMRLSQSAYFQSQAYFLAGDMIDRMRANPRAIENGDYDDIDTDEAANDPGCANAFCTPAQQAEQDVFDWRGYFLPAAGTVSPVLPGAEGLSARGTVTAMGEDRYRISVRWVEVIGSQEVAEDLDVFFVAESIE